MLCVYNLTKFISCRRALIDTGVLLSIIKKKNVPADILKNNKKERATNWHTNSRNFLMLCEVELVFNLPDFSPTKEITHCFAADETENDTFYDAIIGRDLTRQLDVDIMYSKGSLVWDNISIPMKTAPKVHEAFKKA